MRTVFDALHIRDLLRPSTSGLNMALPKTRHEFPSQRSISSNVWRFWSPSMTACHELSGSGNRTNCRRTSCRSSQPSRSVPCGRSYQVPYVHVSVTLIPKRKPNRKFSNCWKVNHFVVLAAICRFWVRNLLPLFQPDRSIPFLSACLHQANPYKQACGGASKSLAPLHYVTAELDAGPIIEQDIIRVSHKCSARICRTGQELERGSRAGSEMAHRGPDSGAW